MAILNFTQVIREFNEVETFGDGYNRLQRAAAQLQVIKDSVGGAIDIEEEEQAAIEINDMIDKLTMALLNHSAKIQMKTYIENIVR